ncbi:DUF4129 domain-containing protein [Nocardia sp. NPDC020380]|uniref:DUF4129 domain-containing protein n=1 Tax=Nocardia sp. NPDC020380 TaxID=3364309 RepID=UPI0037B60EA0
MNRPPKPEDRQPIPPEPALGPAAVHLAAAEQAALHADYRTALRERYRAVTRGLEQRGILEEQRARTARETAQAATTVSPEAAGLPSAAHSFDEVVYGGRPAAEAEYRLLEQADRFSVAPPPVDAPAEITEQRKPRKSRKPARERGNRELPAWLGDWRLWAAIAGILAVLVLAYVLTHLGSPTPPTPPAPTTPPHAPVTTPPPAAPPPNTPPPNFGAGQDSLFQQLPGWLAFGGLQFLIAWVIVLWWRGRRRGAVVGEPLPVEAPAGELLAGQAGLYRKSRDHNHVADTLRAAALRRLRPGLGTTADTPADAVTAVIAARTGADPGTVRSALYDPVDDRGSLELVAAQLEWIEAEVL